MKIDLREAMKDVTETYESAYLAICEKYEVKDIDELDDEKKEVALKEVDDIVFKQDAEDEPDEGEDEKKLKESLLEAADVIASFAEKSGKSTEEVESQWKEAKQIADEQGHDEPEYVVGILKKMLKISESVKKKLHEDAGEEYASVDYYDDMDSEFDCHPSKIVALNALAMATQVHLFHLNTVSYAEHMAFKDFYEDLEDLSDELIEKLLSMGYDLTLDGEIIRTFTFALTNDEVDAAIRGFRDIVSEGIESTQDEDYASINDVMIDMQKKVDELLYKLTLK